MILTFPSLPFLFPCINTPLSCHTGQNMHTACYVCMCWVATLSFFLNKNFFVTKLLVNIIFQPIVASWIQKLVTMVRLELGRRSWDLLMSMLISTLWPHGLGYGLDFLNPTGRASGEATFPGLGSEESTPVVLWPMSSSQATSRHVSFTTSQTIGAIIPFIDEETEA